MKYCTVCDREIRVMTPPVPGICSDDCLKLSKEEANRMPLERRGRRRSW